jgi:hypothetical protein
MDVAELRQWIEDALSRHQRDLTERAEQPAEASTEEIVDAVWGRLPLQVRRQVSRAQVQASLTMLSLRYGLAGVRPSAAADGGPSTAAELRPPSPAAAIEAPPEADSAPPHAGGAHRS